METQLPSPLSGHTLPDAGAVIRHDPLGVSLVLSWDACAASPLELRERQVTPNHVLYHLGGEPIFGDGAPAHDEGFLDVALEDVAALLTDAQRDDVTRAFGSTERWARMQQAGLLGAANTVVLDGESGYFPPGERRGRLAYEMRADDRHVVTAECVDFYNPRYGLARARRTVSLNAAGVAWIVDDYAVGPEPTPHPRGAGVPPAVPDQNAGPTPAPRSPISSSRAHPDRHFAWQAYLRRGCSLGDASLRVRLAAGGAGAGVTLGWDVGAVDDVGLHRFPTYPAAAPPGEGLGWPDAGSERLRLATRGRAARFAVCLVPWWVDEVRVTQAGPGAFQATWSGGAGSDRFELPGLSGIA